MNRTSVLAALACPVLLSSLASCVSPPGGTRPIVPVVCKNTSGICQIPITVTVVDNQCTVVVPDADADKTVARIQWAINAGNAAASDVTFISGPGIQFRDPTGWLVRPTVAGDKRALAAPYTSHKGAYYSIHMQWIVGQTTYPCDVDPIINNDFDY